MVLQFDNLFINYSFILRRSGFCTDLNARYFRDRRGRSNKGHIMHSADHDFIHIIGNMCKDRMLFPELVYQRSIFFGFIID